MQGLAELLSCTCVLENRTLFKNIYLLPVASAWTFNQDLNTEKSLYFTPDIWEKQPWLEKNFFYERLQETFKKILLRYFRANQKIGISLTGGVDTRMIMAYADLPTGKYPCYTFGGMYRDCYDVKLAKKIAIECHQTHQTLPVDYNFLSNFSRYASSTIYITDGYLDVSGASEIYVNKLARDIAPIRMTGNFGGEVLRSIRHLNATPPMQNLFHHDFNQYTQRVKNTLDKYDKEPLSFILFNDSPWHNNNRLVSEQSQLTLRTPYMDNDLVALMYRMQCDIRNDKEMSLRLIRDGKPSLGKIVTDKGLCVDALFPLSIITHVFYEFLAKAEYAYDYGMPQWIARLDYLFRYMHFEKLFIGRHKFNHFRLWYRDDLADYVKSILLDERTLSRPYLNRKCLENVVQGHTKGHQNYTTEITQMLTVELIQRLLIEQR
jgi:asparagine synthase (glutamine-hydrolysing)